MDNQDQKANVEPRLSGSNFYFVSPPTIYK